MLLQHLLRHLAFALVWFREIALRVIGRKGGVPKLPFFHDTHQSQVCNFVNSKETDVRAPTDMGSHKTQRNFLATSNKEFQQPASTSSCLGPLSTTFAFPLGVKIKFPTPKDPLANIFWSLPVEP